MFVNDYRNRPFFRHIFRISWIPMDASNGIYELFILLGNETTMCMPYYVKNGTISSKQLHSSKIPSSISITDSKISIGKIRSSNQQPSKGQDICGFVDSFFGLTNDKFVTELRSQCSCEVLITSEGQVEYRVKDLNNQILTPGVVLKLFLKYVILYECYRSNIQIKNVTVAYPVYCSRHHEEYLVYLLKSLDSYNVRCVSQLPCFITSLLPIDLSPCAHTNVLLFYADYGLFHIFACTVYSRHLTVRRHLKSTQLSHHSFINRIYADILEKMQKKSFSTDSSTTLFKACYQMLNRLAYQTLASMNLLITEGQLVYTVTDDSIYYMMRPILSHLTSDLNKLLVDLHWTRIPTILTGESSSLFIYRRWYQEDFPNVPFCCCHDIMEMVLHNMNPGLPVIRSISEETETQTQFSVMNPDPPNFTSSSSILSTLRDESIKEKSKTSSDSTPLTTSSQGAPSQEDASRSVLSQTDLTHPDVSKPIPSQADSSQEDAPKSILSQPNSSHTDMPKSTPSQADTSQTDVSKSTPSQANSKTSSTEKQPLSSEFESWYLIVVSPLSSMTIEVHISQDDRDAIFIPYQIKNNSAKSDSETTTSHTSHPKSTVTSLSKLEGTKNEKDAKAKLPAQNTRRLSERSHRRASVTALQATREQLRPRRHTREEKKEKKEKKEEEKEFPGTEFIWVSSDPLILPQEPGIDFLSEFNVHKIDSFSIYSTKGKWEENLISGIYVNSSLQERIMQRLDDRTRFQRYDDGSTYSGSVLQGKRHGSGTLTYSDGSSYQGGFRENNRHGRGALRKNNRCYFEGIFENDCPVSGILTFNNGARYDGTFNQGKPHGEGTYYANGHDATWDGHWEHGVMDGTGAYFFDNNDYFDGTMAQGKPHGAGIIYTKQGKVIVEGEWKEGQRDGSFVLYTPDYSYWKVTYVQDVLEGECTFFNEKGKQTGQGTFHNNLFTGKGKFVFLNGTHFEGDIKNGQYDGKGCYRYGDQMSLTATYVNGIKEGSITICKGDELVFRGNCDKGHIQGYGEEFKQGEIVYSGEYAHGVRSGNATVTLMNGYVYKGMVKDNMLSGMGTVYSEKGDVFLHGRFRKNMYIGGK